MKVAASLAIIALSSALFADPCYTGFVSGTFSDPELKGYGYNSQISGGYYWEDNTDTAVYTGFGTNAITWGTGTAVISHSGITFTGATFDSVASGQEFELGTIEYLNGGTDPRTTIFGGILNLNITLTNGSTTIVDPLQVHYNSIGTINYEIDADADADFLNFDSLGIAFHVVEQQSDTAVVMGRIEGDPHFFIDSFQLSPDDQNGFLTTAVPEPASIATFGLGLAFLRKRRKGRDPR
ncbi:MAG: choice-of-anchor K domain-containing protein [Armatimonadetes bacterium]|nr:choice-of-anchor K domain-containing protein [Armatimonadota bacterium]